MMDRSRFKKIIAVAAALAAAMALAACGRTGAAPEPPAAALAPAATSAPPAVTAAPTSLPTPAATPTSAPVATPTPVPTATPVKKIQSPYYIYVEKGSHTVTIYGEDENGDYTVVVAQYLAALGKTAMLTPVGKFTLGGERERWHTFKASELPSGKIYGAYAVSFYKRLFIHGPLYRSKNNNSMNWSAYGELGKNETHGCIRICAGGAYWIYTHCPNGTVLEIVNGSPRGTQAEKPPKPGEPNPNWDPTDPTPPGEEPEDLSVPTPVPTQPEQ